MRCAACDDPHPPTDPCATLVSLRSGLSGTLLFPREGSTPVRLPELGRPLAPGTQLGLFRIQRTLGSGGMGTVYLAEHELLGKQVALKVLHDRLALDAALVRRFITEARTIGRITHEHVVSLFDLQVVPPGHYVLVMEYLEGTPLSELLGKPMTPREAVHILGQVCDALDAAHALGVVHRDLKPANVFLTRRGDDPHHVKLLDFGIAKLMADAGTPQQTVAGLVLGTPEYMAPEQCNGEPVDGRTDLYALGVLAYQLLTGTLPFTGRTATELFMAHVQQQPVAPHVRVPSLPEALSRVVLRALEKRPADRFPSATALRTALEATLRTPTPVPRPAPLEVRLTLPGGRQARTRCIPVSRAGLHVALPPPLPPLRAELEGVLLLRGGELPCRMQVVQHVTDEQARTWGLEPGVGVELLNATPTFLEQLHRRQLSPPTAGAQAAPPAEAPPVGVVEVEALLGQFARAEDHYALLRLPRDAELSRVTRAARAARMALEEVLQRPVPLPVRDRAQLLLERVSHAQHVLGHPERRADYDASLHNWRGVARCLEMGLSAHGLQRAQRRYHQEHPRRAAQAAVQFHTARALEKAGKWMDALAAYEYALELDPLDLVSHQQHHALSRRGLRPQRAESPG